MDRFFRKDIFQKVQVCYFFVSWLSGLLLGMWFANAFSDSFSALMRGLLSSSVSIVGLMAIVFFPLLSSAFCLVFHKPFFFLVLSFTEALSFGFVGTLVMNNIPSGSWLILFLILFPNLPIYAMLFRRWFFMISCKHTSVWTVCYTSAILGIIVVGLHYLVITPLLQGLF